MNDVKRTGVVKDMVGALSSAPLILGLLIFNLIWLVALGYFTLRSNDQWENIVQTVLKTCGPKIEGKLGKNWKLQSERSSPYTLLPLEGKVPEDGVPFELTTLPYPDL